MPENAILLVFCFFFLPERKMVGCQTGEIQADWSMRRELLVLACFRCYLTHTPELSLLPIKTCVVFSCLLYHYFTFACHYSWWELVFLDTTFVGVY